MSKELQLARRLAPEDINAGDFIAITAVVHEVYLCSRLDREYGPYEPLRLTCTECSDGSPLRVVAVCLPFVLIADGSGQRRALDARRHQFVRLSEDFARKALKKRKAGDGLGLPV
jgi:hypothetical protein